MIIRDRQSGYSLLELVIYLGLFALISVVMIHSLLTVMRTYAQAAAFRSLQTNGELVMERVTREIRQASTITVGSSTFGVSPGSVTLVGTDENNVSHTVVIRLVNGVIELVDNGVTTTLTENDVTVESFIVRRFTTITGEGVKIELGMTTENNTVISAYFYDSIVLRGI